MSNNDETDFVQQLQTGDEQSFREFMALYKKKAYSLAYGLTGNHHDAIELSQEAFTKAYFAIKSFKQKSSLYTWFCRILINLCLRHNKKQAKWPKLFFTANKQEAIENPDAVSEDTASPINPEAAAGISGAAAQLLNNELRQKIDQAVQKLPEYQKLVFILRKVEGLTIEQTAEIMACRPGTVKSHLYRARRKLRKLLLPYLKGRE